jgi:RNA polymerase sigma-70 factor (ECF subfamily)
VLKAQGGSTEAQPALAELCECYYEPVFRFIHREGRDEDTARDLTQEFFAGILKRGGFGMADRSRGRFRSYLLGAVKHFLADVRKYRTREKRGGGMVHDSFEAGMEGDAGEREHSERIALNHDRVFDRAWAMAIMARALKALESEFHSAGKARQFDAMYPWLVGDTPELSQAEVAVRLGMTEGAIKVSIHRMRLRFRALLRMEIAQTLAEGESIEAELRYLGEVFNSEPPCGAGL